DGCIFFHDKMADMPAMSEIFKDTYCRGDNTSCARHVVFQALGRGNVPRDLYPNDNDRASDLVAS
ncbi:MAG: hypothetical protein HZB13_17735, partial [Acidobacteria bacterium]|nr:hypothetical protein [Acidobacteriota bacterium]